MKIKDTLHKLLLTGTAVSMLAMQGCDADFEELNTNPNAAASPTPEYLFTEAQLDALNIDYFSSVTLACGGSIQHYSTYKEVPAIGDKYLSENYTYGFFTQAYPTVVNEIQTVIDATSENPEDVNLLSVARIWRVYAMHRITDLYGDVPYASSAQGYSESNYSPSYDAQQAIYTDMLNELAEAAAAMDPSQPTMESADLMYGGDVTQWKKFAYSLMLRLGMRLTEVDPAMAQTWVQNAIAGGVIMDDADNGIVEYTDGPQTFNRNPIAQAMINGDYRDGQNVDNIEGGKFAKTLIDHLKTTNDPRLNVMSVVWVESPTGGFVADTATAIQEGMPNGAYNSRPAEFGMFSEPNPATILQYSAPLLVLTNAETSLLLAEASIRGWYQGDPAALYQEAAASSMRSWALFGAAGTIAESKIAAYQAANPYPSAGSFEEQMNAIQTQKWVSLYLDEIEIFSNWRRTGYPQLTAVNYPGNLTGGTIPRRFIYPPSEESVNAANFYEAIDRQGANLLTTRVWWDSE